MAGWFTELKRTTRPAGTVYCFHAAGGSSAAFRPWAAHLPAAVALVGVDLPGRAAHFHAPPVASLDRAVSALAAHPAFLAPHAPFAFFGHSLGALVAFELARALERAGRPGPRHLVAAGQRAPHLPAGAAPVHDLPDEAFVEALRAYEGTPDEVFAEPELLELLLPALRADFALAALYRFAPGPPLLAPITAVGGDRDPTVDPARLGEWARHGRGPGRVRIFPGRHFFVRDVGADLAALTAEPLARDAAPPAAGP